MEMRKSCVVNHHTYDTKMFGPTPKSRWYGDEHFNDKNISQWHYVLQPAKHFENTFVTVILPNDEQTIKNSQEISKLNKTGIMMYLISGRQTVWWWWASQNRKSASNRSVSQSSLL